MSEERRQPVQRTSIQVRLPADLFDRIAAIADREDRSLNGQIVHALREWLAEHPNG